MIGTVPTAVIASPLRHSVGGLSILGDGPADWDGSAVAMGIVACIMLVAGEVVVVLDIVDPAWMS